MGTLSRQPSPTVRRPHASTGPAPVRMAIAFVVSWVAMLAHNLFELPLTPVDIENSGPLLVDLVLLAAYWCRPTSRGVQVPLMLLAVAALRHPPRATRST